MGEFFPISTNLLVYIPIKKLLWKVKVEDIPRGERLKTFSRKWRFLSTNFLVKRGMMSIYMDRDQAESYWRKNKFKEFYVNKREERVMKQKIKDSIKNKFLITTDRESIYNAINKTNKNYELIINIRRIN
jgi:hypothetical protein